MTDDSDRALHDVALEGPLGGAYDEETFGYFLAIERARADRSNRILRLLLVNLAPAPGRRVHMGPRLAASLLDGLRVAVRETDVVGWFRDGRVAGAVLSERAISPDEDGTRVVLERVREVLHQRLPAGVVARLRVRVRLLPPRPRRG